MLLFEKSKNSSSYDENSLNPHKQNSTFNPKVFGKYLRKSQLNWPNLGELDIVRHFTKLSQKNFCIDKNFYPLGSCTMKYNPKAAHALASLPGFLNAHPLAPASHTQGLLKCLYELQEFLKEITGMHDIALSPMAGAQGEYAGLKMIKSYHEARKDFHRNEIIVPDAAHGTNPASAAMCGFIVKEVKPKRMAMLI